MGTAPKTSSSGRKCLRALGIPRYNRRLRIEMPGHRVDGTEGRMTFLPGWDDLDVVTKVHWWLEITGIVCLGLLVAAEVAALVYDTRKERLAAQHEADLQNKISDEKF